MRLEFNQIGTFQALYAAEAWCRENGISVGQSSATGPTGLLFGSYGWIAKWRNLTPKERSELHGTMDGDFREGPVVINLKDAEVEAHAACLRVPRRPSMPRTQPIYVLKDMSFTCLFRNTAIRSCGKIVPVVKYGGNSLPFVHYGPYLAALSPAIWFQESW